MVKRIDWKKIFARTFYVYFLAIWLAGVTYSCQFDSHYNHANPQPSASQTEALVNHGRTVYITPKEKHRQDILETFAVIGFVSAIPLFFFVLKLESSPISRTSVRDTRL